MTGADALAERRRRRLWLLGASAVLVGVLIAMAIALNRAGDESGTTTGPPEGVAETNALFRGIPQRGDALGDPKAPVTLVEFSDLQCPHCGRYSREVMPEVVSRYVRPGRVKVHLVNLEFLGEDSTEAARMGGAAARQNKLFQFVDLVYRNQGSENSGWVTDAYLRRIARAIGLDVERAFGYAKGPRAVVDIAVAKDEALRAGVKATPTVLIFRAGSSKPRRLDAGEVSREDVTEALDDALDGG